MDQQSVVHPTDHPAGQERMLHPVDQDKCFPLLVRRGNYTLLVRTHVLLVFVCRGRGQETVL